MAGCRWTLDRPAAAGAAHLVIAEVHRWLAPRFRRAGWIVVPNQVRWQGNPDALPPAGGLIRIEVVARGEEVAFVVADNGSGLSLEAQARCFDLFFTTKDVGEGTGLGLSVAHNIVTNHGGRIELVSEPGQGATFTVYLPRESLEPGPAGASPTGEETAGGGAVTQP